MIWRVGVAFSAVFGSPLPRTTDGALKRLCDGQAGVS